MDNKIKQYENIVKQILADYTHSFNQYPKSIEAKLVFDTERQAYQVINVGWWKEEFVVYIVFFMCGNII